MALMLELALHLLVAASVFLIGPFQLPGGFPHMAGGLPHMAIVRNCVCTSTDNNARAYWGSGPPDAAKCARTKPVASGRCDTEAAQHRVHLRWLWGMQKRSRRVSAAVQQGRSPATW